VSFDFDNFHQISLNFYAMERLAKENSLSIMSIFTMAVPELLNFVC